MRQPCSPRTAAWVAAAWLALVCAGCRSIPRHPMTVEQAQAKLDAALPAGTSRDQVERWFRSQGIEPYYNSTVKDNPDVERACIGTGELRPDDLGGCVSGWIVDTGRDFLVRYDLRLHCILDRNSRTVRNVVGQVGTGP